MPITTGLVIAGTGALIKGVSGFFQNKKANALAKANPRPTYNIPDEFKNNLTLAKQLAQTGLPQQQYNNAYNNINRNQAGALGVLSRSANPGANLAALVRANNDATLNLDAQDAAARMNNQRGVMQQNTVLGQQQLAKQQWDSLGKYQENAAAASALKGAGLQNMMGAVNDIGTLGTTALLGSTGGYGSIPQQRYAGGNFFQRLGGGLNQPNPDLPQAYGLNYNPTY